MGLEANAANYAPLTPLTPLNVDLSTVTTAADLAFGLGDPLREVIHLDAQASADADSSSRLSFDFI